MVLHPRADPRIASVTNNHDSSNDHLFDPARDLFESEIEFLEGGAAAAMTHAEIEARLEVAGREVIRRLFQSHLWLRAEREPRLEAVTDADGAARTTAEASCRCLSTVFGDVQVPRLAYRSAGHPNLHPGDAVLNLPAGQHSHGLRRRAVTESIKSSFDQAADTIRRACGVDAAKRQISQLCRVAAVDFDAFYAHTPRPHAAADDIVVISADGKGIVMRPDALRPATAAAAAATQNKLTGRLSKGEKRNRKRMATVGAVYDITPAPRRPCDIIGNGNQPAPKAAAKWVTASLTDDAAAVIASVFDEAERRDPHHRRPWIGLVDGNNHQIDRIRAEADTRGVTVTILIDIVHVLEYLWSAAWNFHDEGDPAAQTWVHEHALAILCGKSSTVAAAIRRKATTNNLPTEKRANADRCADYLLNKGPYLDYPTALAAGTPIATGIIEGACRHLVADRLDITGARWGTQGAEAILKLRALHTNGDLDAYWDYHLQQEHRRTHHTRYQNAAIPRAA